MKKNEDGSYSLTPRHSPEKGLDHLGGKQEPGAKIDLWTNTPGDRHLHWMIKPLAGTLAATSGGATETSPSTYVAPEIKPEAIPRGEVKNFTFTGSTIFPGTVRQGSVFIPAQYDASKPACVSVKFDGYNPAEKALLESLIATGEMPVTVGVFIRPGELPAPVKGTIGRRNRDLEYDGMGDSNVRFLVDELLPFVAKEFDLKLSTSGNDRCISGGSSGGIAAFNAAWERPDAFSRVYANSGSFVAFRGGHEFPTLVRKFEAKPIRAYLTTGMRDMENCAGDWFLLDQEMDKALKFSGYDYSFRIINGGHVAGYYDYYREAMSYLWKGWPKPVEAGPSAPGCATSSSPASRGKPSPRTTTRPEGRPATPSGKSSSSNAEANAIRRIDLDGKIVEFSPDAGHADALTFGPEGQLYAISSQTGKITSYDQTGKPTVIADGIPGRHLLATPDGGLYATGNGMGEIPATVWFLKDGKKTQGRLGPEVPDRPCLSPRSLAPVRGRRGIQVGL